ncbi:MAG: glutamate--tRNA ligase [Rhodospirillales bacterium]|nr:glutamate--tRNA ligase [Rhodospirillales bacterium]MBO6786748.1 glutamate--tRNA ligase [Rhodospirillales bacterium]
MPVVTRFAPSPTGFLHIGGARTALFNWLFAKHHEKYGDGGTFLLRIEDTDRARSTDEAVAAIYDGLSWLGLDWDGDAISQFARRERHQEVVQQLLDKGMAYKCYCTPEELTEMREKARAEGKKRMYDGTWRDRDPSEAPDGVQPAIRLRAPLEGETVIEDLVQGRVEVANEQLDDMVLLRADGTPTYMLAVVVDDFDMGITHVIRGDDHLVNAFRQVQLFKAMDWPLPQFAHIPLIHGPDGAKLSKRHGALGVDAYRDMGYLPEALRNYLMRLSWSHGDEEIISTEQAIEWFGLDAVGRGAARFDFQKLESLNGHYIRQADNERLTELVMDRLKDTLDGKLAEGAADRVKMGMDGLKERAKNLKELAENAAFYVISRPLEPDEKAAQILTDEAKQTLAAFRADAAGIEEWTEENIQATAKAYAEAHELKLGKVAQPLRAAVTGTTVSPGIFEVMAVLGRDETLARLDDVN